MHLGAWFQLFLVVQDSLGGGAHTLMVVNLPPGVPYYHHVLNTLQFAAKSRNIVNKPIVVQQKAKAEVSMASTQRVALTQACVGLNGRQAGCIQRKERAHAGEATLWTAS